MVSLNEAIVAIERDLEKSRLRLGKTQKQVDLGITHETRLSFEDGLVSGLDSALAILCELAKNAPTTFGCNGSTIKTRSGKYIDLMNPSVDDIDLESIAHALSNICRYGGHVDFYSVAEHSYHCCYAARLIGGCSAEEAKAVLMHDAAEAFLGDCVKPLKICLPDYQAVEAKMEKAIGERFGIDFEKHHTIIKYWDKVLLKEEKRFFWPNDTEEWSGFSEIPDYDLNHVFRTHAPFVAKGQFLQYAMSLGIQ